MWSRLELSVLMAEILGITFNIPVGACHIGLIPMGPARAMPNDDTTTQAALQARIGHFAQDFPEHGKGSRAEGGA